MISKGFSLVVLLAILQIGKSEDYLLAVAYRGKYAYIRHAAGETGCLVEIQYPHFVDRLAFSLLPFNGRSDHIHRSYPSALRISAKLKITGDVTVTNAAFVVSGSDENANFVVVADGFFSPLPLSALGTKYIIPSSLASNSGYRSLLLIATHNTSTTVDIFLRMNRGGISFASQGYFDGDVLTLQLNPYQTFNIFTSCDLNGTVITSDHSIAVFSGMEYSYKYMVYDQLLPVKHYGQEYVVTVDDFNLELQVISEHSHVLITFSSGATVSTGERRLYNRSLEKGESLHFTTTTPVQVILSRAKGYSSAFTTVPPVHSYVTHRVVWLNRFNLGVKLKVLTDKRSTVLIEDKEVNARLTWRYIAGSRYKVGTLVHSRSAYFDFTSISSNFPFTVLSFSNGSVRNTGYKVSAQEPVPYTGQIYLVAMSANTRHNIRKSWILASAGETGGQWQVQDPHTGRIWSRRFSPYNTDRFYPKPQEANRIILMLVIVRDDAIQIKGINAIAQFSPLPVSALGTKYIMSSCLPTNDNIYRDKTWYISVLVIATHSKKADIDVIFRLDGNVTYDDRTYIDGDTLSVRLDRYQTFSLNSSSDMTRTVINATEEIAVYSGTYDDHNAVFTTFEQLLPVKHYGHEYIVAILDPYRRQYQPYQLQVVTDHYDMNIMFNNGSSISVSKDGVYRTLCGNRETFYFNTTRPVMATLCATGTYYYEDGLVVVPPVSLYSKLATLEEPVTTQILTDQDNNNVKIQQTDYYAPTVFSSSITWRNVSGTRYKVGTMRGSQYTTTIRSNVSFAVLGYYYYNIHKGGYSFRTNPDTETSTPDGSDVKLKTVGFTHGGSSDNAAVTVGVVCGIIILALLVVFVVLVYVFYSRRKKKPVTRAAEQCADAPSTSMAIYAVPDRAAGCAAGEGTYTGLRFKATPSDINIVYNTTAYEDEPTE